jgi:hypothetical protein
MPEDRSAPWAPSPPEGSRPLDGDFSSGRMLCEDGFCLGVMRVAHDAAPYRGVAEAICPACGRRVPLSRALDPAQQP